MNKQFTEEEIKFIAAQLRKPEGEHGVKIGEVMNEGNGPMNLHSIAVLNPQPNETILEIGMGNGYFVKNIVLLDPSINYVGCDYSELMVEKSTEINSEFIEQDRVSFVHGTIQELPFADDSFNKIMTINTFYFWEDPVAVLKELKRVLKKEGEFILSVRPKSNLEQFPVTKYGFSIQSNEQIIRLLKSNGFNRIEVTEIKEPDAENFLNTNKRETLILQCKL